MMLIKLNLAALIKEYPGITMIMIMDFIYESYFFFKDVYIP